MVNLHHWELYVQVGGWHGKTSMTLGLRKLMCIVSASAFPLTTLIDISRWTIIRCEINTWATLLGRTRAWYKIVNMLLIELCRYWAQGNDVSFDLVPAGEVHDIKRKDRTPTPPTQWQTQDDAIRDDFGLPCFLFIIVIPHRKTESIRFRLDWHSGFDILERWCYKLIHLEETENYRAWRWDRPYLWTVELWVMNCTIKHSELWNLCHLLIVWKSESIFFFGEIGERFISHRMIVHLDMSIYNT